jgi:hypothetical protein
MSARQILRLFLPLAVLMPFAAPAMAQDMGDNGWTLPDFLFSRGTQLARAVCETKQGNCRPDVRAQMEIERTVSLIAPWFLLAGAMAGVLAYVKRAERKKEAHRRKAKRNHVPGSFRKTTAPEDKEERRSPDDDDDRFR